jgi:hypothetical protein
VAVYKPGTSTWDTDDAKEAARKIGKVGAALQTEEEGVIRRARKARGIDPVKWWRETYKPRYQESSETVGAASRSVTSTTSAVVTKNERVVKLVHRCALACVVTGDMNVWSPNMSFVICPRHRFQGGRD